MDYYIINITTYQGTCPDASHYYGKLYRHDGHIKIPIEETGEWSITTFDLVEELKYEITKEQAIILDKKSYDRTRTYERLWENGVKTTEKFDTVEDIIKAGIEYCLKLKHKGKIVVLYEGELEKIIDLKETNDERN